MATEVLAGNIPLHEAFEMYLRKRYGGEPTSGQINSGVEELMEAFARSELVANVYKDLREVTLPASDWLRQQDEVCEPARAFFFGDLGAGLNSGCTPYTATLAFDAWLRRISRSHSKAATPRRSSSFKAPLAEWYRNTYVKANKWQGWVSTGKKSPSEADDLRAAKAVFGKDVTRPMIRDLRNRFAPSNWKLPGRKGS